MTKTLDYSAELYADITDSMTDYLQTGETVCGAQDPAVIAVSESLGTKYPELAGYSTVRVVDRYVSPWKSDTLLVFSNSEATPEEYALYEALDECQNKYCPCKEGDE